MTNQTYVRCEQIGDRKGSESKFVGTESAEMGLECWVDEELNQNSKDSKKGEEESDCRGWET